MAGPCSTFQMVAGGTRSAGSGVTARAAGSRPLLFPNVKRSGRPRSCSRQPTWTTIPRTAGGGIATYRLCASGATYSTTGRSTDGASGSRCARGGRWAICSLAPTNSSSFRPSSEPWPDPLPLPTAPLSQSGSCRIHTCCAGNATACGPMPPDWPTWVDDGRKSGNACLHISADGAEHDHRSAEPERRGRKNDDLRQPGARVCTHRTPRPFGRC